MFIKVQNNIATREPVPDFLPYDREALADLSGVSAPGFDFSGVAWLPEVDQTPALGPDQTFDGTEALTVDAQLQVVVVVRGVRDLTPEEIHDRWLADNPVPSACQRRQGRLVLLSMGLLDEAEATIAAIADETERRAAQIEYEADTWERANPFLAQFWGQLGGTPDSLDDAFRLAITL